MNWAQVGFFTKKRFLKFPHCLAVLVPTSRAMTTFELTPNFFTVSLNKATSWSVHLLPPLLPVVVVPTRARHAESAAWWKARSWLRSPCFYGSVRSQKEHGNRSPSSSSSSLRSSTASVVVGWDLEKWFATLNFVGKRSEQPEHIHICVIAPWRSRTCLSRCFALQKES